MLRDKFAAFVKASQGAQAAEETVDTPADAE
jgi:hypothetical protein